MQKLHLQMIVLKQGFISGQMQTIQQQFNSEEEWGNLQDPINIATV